MGPEGIAEAFGVPVGTLQRVFRQEAGVALIDHLRRVRVKQAKRLLAKTNLRIAEVCRAVGWARADSGARAFKREVGCSMRAYRRRVQGR